MNKKRNKIIQTNGTTWNLHRWWYVSIWCTGWQRFTGYSSQLHILPTDGWMKFSRKHTTGFAVIVILQVCVPGTILSSPITPGRTYWEVTAKSTPEYTVFHSLFQASGSSQHGVSKLQSWSPMEESNPWLSGWNVVTVTDWIAPISRGYPVRQGRNLGN